MAGYLTPINLPAKGLMMSCQSTQSLLPLTESLILIRNLLGKYELAKWNWMILGDTLFKLNANLSSISTKRFPSGDHGPPLPFSLQIAKNLLHFFTINHVFQQDFITCYNFSSLCVKMQMVLRCATLWRVQWPLKLHNEVREFILRYTWNILLSGFQHFPLASPWRN